MTDAWRSNGGRPVASSLQPGKRVHFVGIGGVGMAALAQYLLSRGVEVSGSDRTVSSTGALLAAHGAAVSTGHEARHVHGADLVVLSAAVTADNPEVLEAADRGLPVIKRAELLAQITDRGRSIAVAGTHGKSTVTAMIAHIVRVVGLEATLFGGAFVRTATDELEGPGWGSCDETFVVEADEYDRSFLRLHPSAAVVTSVEFDHPDCYSDLDEMVSAYKAFTSQTKDCLILGCGAADILGISTESPNVQIFGIETATEWSAVDVSLQVDGSRFAVHRRDTRVGTVRTRLPGLHNVENCLAALAGAAWLSGTSTRNLLAALESFRGIARRLEVRGEAGGVTLVDDYAHHPSEIAAAIQALEIKSGRLRLLFQPHTYSRTQALMDDFVTALGEADEVILIDVYGAREQPLAGVSSENLARLLRASGVNASFMSSSAQAVDYVVSSSLDGDTLVTMGAGDVTNLGPLVLSGLEHHRPRESSPRYDVASHRSKHFDSERLGRSLEEAGLSRVKAGEPMSRHTSWRIGGPADLFAVAESPEELHSAWTLATNERLPFLVIGGGSNVLVADDGIEGLVVLNRIRSMMIQDSDEPVRVEAGSGVFFARLASFSARHGWAGLEWGVAIPGTVGAGVVNNSGAHHGDVERTLIAAEVLDAKGHMERVIGSELEFRYRSSRLKQVGDAIKRTDLVVTRAWFAVQRDEASRSLGLIDELLSQRLATQPVTEPSAGSTFKNPSDGSAGSLIEQAGLKGHRIGDAQISSKHANFIVNLGSASASDVVALIGLIVATVQRKFGVTLETEIQPVGRWPQKGPLEIMSTAGGS